MIACACPDENPVPSLTPELRVEMMERAFKNLVAEDHPRSALKVCWVSRKALENGEECLDESSYPALQIDGKNHQAHNVVLALVHNRFLDTDNGEQGNHRCNNPLCRRPSHLELGSHAKNMKYMKDCGRAATGDRNGHHTHPEATPRGDTHYRTKLKGELRRIAIQLIKKYGHLQGYAPAIAEYFGDIALRGTIHNLKRTNAHLDPNVADTSIELEFAARRWGAEKPRPKKEVAEEYVRRIRERFHETPVHERSALIDQLAREYQYTPTWIRKILNREVYEEVAPEIPIPTNFGIGRRIRPRDSKGGDHE